MTFRIPLARPFIGPGEIAAASEALGSGWLVRGPRVEALEKAVAGLAGVDHAVAFSSGTAALWAAMRCLGVGPGDEVVVPALTFPAPAAAAVFNGAAPVFADVDPGTFNIDPRDVGRRMTDRTRVLVAVDQFGMPARAPELERIAKRHGAVLLVDAACSLGSRLEGRPCGSFGEASALSFHPRKVVTTGEGGMVLTGHYGMARSLRAVRNHGIDDSGRFEAPGLNLRMGEVQAAVGVVQVGKLEEMVARRRELARVYAGLLPPEIRLQEVERDAEPNWQTLAAVLPEAAGEAGRDRFVEILRGQGIEAGPASHCVPALPAYSAFARDPEDFPNALRVARLGVALPLHHSLGIGEVEEVARAAAMAIREIGAAGGRP